jgi:hypothetical protein
MSESLLLTAAERNRFASWLENEAEAARLMIEQMKTFPKTTASVLIMREELERSAALILARKLRSIEDQSIGG